LQEAKKRLDNIFVNKLATKRPAQQMVIAKRKDNYFSKQICQAEPLGYK